MSYGVYTVQKGLVVRASGCVVLLTFATAKETGLELLVTAFSFLALLFCRYNDKLMELVRILFESLRDFEADIGSYNDLKVTTRTLLFRSV